MRNRFYDRRLRPGRKDPGFSVTLSRAEDVLREAEYAWIGLSEVRRKARRAQMYGFEDQWGDLMRDDSDGQIKTEC